MAESSRPRTYHELYAFFRDRVESVPASRNRLRGVIRETLCRPGYGSEAWYWGGPSSGEPRQIRSYGTECGFSICHPETLWHRGYEWIAPLNTVSFASTGSDGCHFSFVTLPGYRWIEECPVVMIVPGGIGGQTRDSGNVIVGENLWEFLGLGLRTGFSVLDMLPCRLDEFLSEYPDHDPRPAIDNPQQVELYALAEQFGLEGWSRAAIEPRLTDLRERYFSQLVFGPPL